MIIPDHKKAATIIVASMHKPELGAPMHPEVELSEEDDEKKGIAEDLLRAIHANSAHDAAMALQAFFECCEKEPHEEASEEE